VWTDPSLHEPEFINGSSMQLARLGLDSKLGVTDLRDLRVMEQTSKMIHRMI